MTAGRYLPLLRELDGWQARARTEHPDVVPCRAGCTACCRGPFDISVSDTALVVDAARRLPRPALRTALDTAGRHVAAMRALEPDWRAPYDVRTLGDDRFDRLSDALAELPCPLLDAAGRCVIYDARPAVCRLMGLGLIDEHGEVLENACPIQDRFPAYRDLPPQFFALDAWDVAESDCHRETARQLFADPAWAGYETTIAAALVHWLAPPETC